MKYRIISTEVENEFIKTKVEYIYDDTSKEIIEVYHAYPQNKDEVILGITNRGFSEQRKVEALSKNILIKAEIDKDESLQEELEIEINEIL
jgi:hypothetical protein